MKATTSSFSFYNFQKLDGWGGGGNKKEILSLIDLAQQQQQRRYKKQYIFLVFFKLYNVDNLFIIVW